MIYASSERVPAHTDPDVNDAIERTTDASIEYYSQHPELIPRRLDELDHEWDIERTLETGSSILSLFGLTMATLHHRRWLILPFAVQSFFLQHALQGWCPPLPVFRRLGIRTPQEIERERHELLRALEDWEQPAQDQYEYEYEETVR